MKYIHFVALHIQNNCAKFQRILTKGIWINLTFFPFIVLTIGDVCVAMVTNCYLNL